MTADEDGVEGCQLATAKRAQGRARDGVGRTADGLLADLARAELLGEDVEELCLLVKQRERRLPEGGRRGVPGRERDLGQRGRRDVPVLRGQAEDDRELAVELAALLDVWSARRGSGGDGQR